MDKLQTESDFKPSPEMKEAGVLILESLSGIADSYYLVEALYIAMHEVHRRQAAHQMPVASATQQW